MSYPNWHDRFAARAAGLLSIERADRDQQSNRMGDRAQSAMGGGGSTGTGRADRDQQSNRAPDAAQRAMLAGKAGSTGSGGVITSSPTTEQLLGFGEPVHNVPTGDEANQPTISRNNPDWGKGPRPGTGDRWGTTLGMDPEEAKRQQQFNSAADAYQNRGLGDWLGDHLLDLVPGFHQVTPDPNDPASYDGGTYHDGWSPVGALTGVLGMASPIPGTSIATGYLGRKVSDALGAEHYTFGENGGWSGEDGSAASSVDQMAQGPSAPAESAPGGVLGGKERQTGTKLFSIADTLRQKTPAPVAIQPSPKAYENLTTYYSNGDKPTTARQPVYY